MKTGECNNKHELTSDREHWIEKNNTVSDDDVRIVNDCMITM